MTHSLTEWEAEEINRDRDQGQRLEALATEVAKAIAEICAGDVDAAEAIAAAFHRDLIDSHLPVHCAVERHIVKKDSNPSP